MDHEFAAFKGHYLYDYKVVNTSKGDWGYYPAGWTTGSFDGYFVISHGGVLQVWTDHTEGPLHILPPGAWTNLRPA